jgi:hypothetical protein
LGYRNAFGKGVFVLCAHRLRQLRLDEAQQPLVTLSLVIFDCQFIDFRFLSAIMLVTTFAVDERKPKNYSQYSRLEFELMSQSHERTNQFPSGQIAAIAFSLLIMVVIVVKMPEQLDAGMKCLLSFLKTDWKLSDYPVRFLELEAADADDKTPKWCVQIVNWWAITGIGDTKELAYADLQKHFENFKKKERQLPRPGTNGPIEFASTAEIDKYEPVANDFFRRILKLDYHGCFISDTSSLEDFYQYSRHDKSNPQNLGSYDEFKKTIFSKIQQTYGCDVSDVKDDNFLTIFKKLESAKHHH